MALAENKSSTLKERPEIELLLLASRTQLSAKHSERIGRLALKKPDWQYTLRAALKHGVMPLLYRQLKALLPELVPADFMNNLETLFYSNSLRNYRLTDELCRVLKLMAARGLMVIPYKGPELALQAYGDLSLRQFNDLDLLVRKDDVAEAASLLRDEGYSQQWQLTGAQEAAYLKSDCEYLFARDEGRIYIDLHWTFVRGYFALKLEHETFRKRLVPFSLGCAEAHTFKTEDLMLILCVHGAKDLWARLVWVSDIAELINAKRDLDWPRMMREAEASGALRIVLLGLFLAHGLLEAALPAEVFQRADDDPVIKMLAARVRERLFSEDASASATEEYRFHLRLHESLGDKARYALRYALTSNPADWNYVRLPDSLFFLYRLIRPVRLLIKHA